MYKQIIIARKDLGMSAGKLAAQVSHASMAFLTNRIRNNIFRIPLYERYRCWEWKYYSNGCGAPGDPESENCWKEKVQKWYPHPDLRRFSAEAFAEGQDYFYVKGSDWDPVSNVYKKLERVLQQETGCYRTEFDIEKDLYEDWINGIFTKVVLQAKNRNQLMKAVEMAKELGWKEGVDYFLIKDCCKTELEPEEVDENGVGRTLTCIGFTPKPAEEIDKIAKKFHIFEGEIV